MFIKLQYTAVCWLISVISLTLANPAYSQQALVKKTLVRSDEVFKEIQRLNQLELPKTNASYLWRVPREQNKLLELSQAATDVVLVTDVKVNSTDKGIELILVTANSLKLQILPKTEGNSYIADIPNAKLQLRSGDFRQEKPVAGIAEVTVANVDANTLRVTVTGEAFAPAVELFDSTKEGLVFGVTPSTSTAQQPTTTPEQKPSQPSASGNKPIELVVTGEQDGYRVPDASTATKTDTPLRDIPASIQIVPRQVLQDQKAVRLQDALQNVSGVTQAGNYGGTGAARYIIRGFEQDGNFRNGFRDADFFTLSEIANLEQVDVLKGPASVLFGEAEPGGIINLVTKQPLSEPYYAADFTAGSYGFYRPTFDISGPLNADKTLLYRLNVAYQNSGSFRDFVDTERIFIAPSLTWKIDTNTTLNLDFEYLNNNTQFDRGIVAIGNRPAPIPISRFLGVPGENDSKTTAYRAGYRLEHQFSKNWQLRNALSITINKVNDFRAEPGDLIDDRFLDRNFTNGKFETDNYSLQTEVIGKFATGSIIHQPLLGIELNRSEGPLIFSRGILSPIDIFSPVNNSVIPTNPLTTFVNRQIRTDRLGIYLQDQITLLDNLKLLVGGRFDFTEQKNDNLLASTSISQSDQAFSPRVGLVYQPIPPISLYASYSSSFVPNIGTSVNGSTFDPAQGTQYEVGVKADLSNRLSATLAAYQITKTNVLTTDPNNLDFSIQVGEQRSRGVELDVAGEILTGWKIIASYAYTDAQITKDNDYAVGNLLESVAKNTVSLWTTYEIQRGSLQGLGFGLGLYYVGDRQGDLDNSFVLPSYFRTDAALYYKRNNWKAAINIKNLFDERYYESSQGRDTIYPGAPLTVLGTISWEF
ncbi:TonB-dependent siderophore receptor [Nostoc sp. UHCC 0926]|uniref:TonB-dependent siderophore receptor n=1 Tax=unclassified Nostoc TaxID=2593658 RepID=UPI00235F079C|nr:TonB-dependent siderophore receptor [Nostoc sp. UHCC 0926]WDD31335.1 TonB-dependent siderophore receptor [Nostoc sp. UHCC 0926]